MRIFLTGATGYIGRAALEALVRAGHHVSCLMRTPEKKDEIEARGGKVVAGDLADPAALAGLAEGYEGYVHAGFESSPRGSDVDRGAITALLDAARRGGGERFLVYTSGVWVLGDTRGPATETAPLMPTPAAAWRPAHEQLVLDAAGDGLRTAVVRPGIVCGGSRGIIGDLIRDAHNGLIRVIGPGTNRWPIVYHRDLAELYVRLASHPDASGLYHATDEADETVNAIVDAVAAHMKTPPDVRRIPLTEAKAKMGAYAAALALDQVVRSPRARALGWKPALSSVTRNAASLVEEWRREAGR